MSNLPYEDKPQYLEIEIITPTHIGVAKENHWMREVDFHCAGGKVYKYNILRYLREKDDINAINAITSALTLGNQIDNRYLNELKEEAEYIFSLSFEPNDIRPQIRTGMGLPILPGSSLKGAVRSVMYNFLLSNIDKNRGPDSVDRTDEVFGRINNNLMRLIRISDADFLPDATELWITKIRSLLKKDEAGWKHQKKGCLREFDTEKFVTVYETLSVGAKAYFKMKITKEFYKLIEGKPIDNKGNNYSVPNGAFVKNNTIGDLFKIINDYTLTYLIAEIDFITKTEGEKSEEILYSLNELKEKTEQAKKSNNNSCIIRLASGSGFHSITGNWQNPTDHYSRKQNNNLPFNKTRRFAVDGERFLPMGFVKLTIIDQATYRQKMAEHQQKAESISLTISKSFSQVVEEAPPKPEIPERFTKKIGKNTDNIPAKIIIGTKGKIQVELHAEGYEGKYYKMNYNSDLEVDKYVYVKFPDEKNKTVTFQKLY